MHALQKGSANPKKWLHVQVLYHCDKGQLLEKWQKEKEREGELIEERGGLVRCVMQTQVSTVSSDRK
jgi:hypothetical protein